MLFQKGDIVLYKKWIGKIIFAYEDNKSYMVELYGYHGFPSVHKQLDQVDLILNEQMKIEA